jgi:hypothetical protein
MKPADLDPDDERIQAIMHTLVPYPPRDPQFAQRGRTAFLEQAKSLRPAVSVPVPERRKGWTNLFLRKENAKMPTLATLLVVISLVFGGAGVTVYASQESDPGQALYPLKLASEDVRAQFANRTQTHLDLSLQFADRRAGEIAHLAQEGKMPSEPVIARWRQEVDTALRLAAGMDDEAAFGNLERIRERLRSQDQILAQVHAGGPSEAVLAQVRSMIQERIRLTDLGLNDPQLFRERVRAGQFDAGPTQPTTPGTRQGGNPWTDNTPTPGSGYGPGPGDGSCLSCTPQATGQGGNPWAASTPTPGSGYGPGPGDGSCLSCTPQATGQGGNPWAASTPTPGSGYGPGPGDGSCLSCTPQATGQGGNPWAASTPTPGSGYGPGPGGQNSSSH